MWWVHEKLGLRSLAATSWQKLWSVLEPHEYGIVLKYLAYLLKELKIFQNTLLSVQPHLYNLLLCSSCSSKYVKNYTNVFLNPLKWTWAVTGIPHSLFQIKFCLCSNITPNFAVIFPISCLWCFVPPWWYKWKGSVSQSEGRQREIKYCLQFIKRSLALAEVKQTILLIFPSHISLQYNYYLILRGFHV